MNYIAATLLYHCEDFMAFWLLVSIFESIDMRDLYIASIKYIILIKYNFDVHII